jgi:hypothetical protein
MKPNDSQLNSITDSIPELIKHLWDLYMAMSMDPALADSAAHIKEAVLTLEYTRRLAFQVTQEDAKQPGRTSRRKKPELIAKEQEEAEQQAWLRALKAGSPLKH